MPHISYDDSVAAKVNILYELNKTGTSKARTCSMFDMEIQRYPIAAMVA